MYLKKVALQNLTDLFATPIFIMYNNIYYCSLNRKKNDTTEKWYISQEKQQNIGIFLL